MINFYVYFCCTVIIVLYFQLLLEAENLICSSLSSEGNKVYMMDYKYSAEVPIADNRTLPDWAKVLEPVRKLPTNVGTRIRNCVYEALDRKPPEWARKILEHSISKEVYKANASGRTKVSNAPAGCSHCILAIPYCVYFPFSGFDLLSGPYKNLFIDRSICNAYVVFLVKSNELQK